MLKVILPYHNISIAKKNDNNLSYALMLLKNNIDKKIYVLKDLILLKLQ